MNSTRFRHGFVYLLIIVAVAVIVLGAFSQRENPDEWPLSRVAEAVRDGDVAKMVARDNDQVVVTLTDGSKWEARVVGNAPSNDLALIKIDASPQDLEPLSLGSSKSLRVGQKVLAVGNPFGLGQTLTKGTISSLGRDVRLSRDVVIRDVIQTDAAINPGNSGGPLVNSTGEVIGINTAIYSPTGSSVGIGFAVPSDTVRLILPGLVSIWPKLWSWAVAVVLVGLFLWWFWRRLQRWQW